MGSISGSIDQTALSRLARGEGAACLATAFDGPPSPALQIGRMPADELPFELRAHELPDDPDADGTDDWGYRIHAAAGAACAVAIAHREIAPVRWVYLGRSRARDGGAIRATFYTDVDVDDWADPWAEPGAASDVDPPAPIRVVTWPARPYISAVLVDAGTAPIALYLGYDAADEPVALVLDAANLGGIVDDRDGDELVVHAQRALAAAAPGALDVPTWHAYTEDEFLPNTAAGVPLISDYEPFGTTSLVATALGELPVPSRTLALWTGYTFRQETWPIAAASLTAIACHSRRSLAAWILRVPASAPPVRWATFGFGEDACWLGDGAADVAVADGGWPKPDLIGLARSERDSPLLCVSGPDLTQAHGAVGFDAADRVTVIVVVS